MLPILSCKVKQKIIIVVLLKKCVCFIIVSLWLFFSVSVSGQAYDAQEKEFVVQVVQQGWHTGIIIETEDVDSLVWPEISDYRHKRYVDIGWGDEKFYQVEGRPFFLAARAVLWPTQSVLRVYPFDLSPERLYGSDARMKTIVLNQEQFTLLCRFISNSYLRDQNNQPQPSTAYGKSNIFFLAKRKYHLFRTCNTWVALAFKNSGFEIRSFCVLNANQLFRQLEKIDGERSSLHPDTIIVE